MRRTPSNAFARGCWKQSLVLLVAAVCCVAHDRAILGANVTWDGSTSSDWNIGANWSTGSVPDTLVENAYFDGTGANLPVTFTTSINSKFGGILVIPGSSFTPTAAFSGSGDWVVGLWQRRRVAGWGDHDGSRSH